MPRTIIYAQIKAKGSIAVLLNLPSGWRMETATDWLKGSFIVANFIVIERPIPISTLNTGPAIVPVIAISPKPFLVMATSALMSPRQLPHAKMVSPNSEVGN